MKRSGGETARDEGASRGATRTGMRGLADPAAGRKLRTGGAVEGTFLSPTRAGTQRKSKELTQTPGPLLNTLPDAFGSDLDRHRGSHGGLPSGGSIGGSHRGLDRSTETDTGKRPEQHE